MTSQHTCSLCRSPLEGEQGFVFCAKCGAPHFFGNATDAFEVFGVARSFSLDERALEDQYYALSKKLHPDRFAGAGASARMKSQELSAVLNQAYLALRNRESRIEALLKASGSLKDNEKSVPQGQIPTDLAEEYFELQEAVMEDPAQAKTIANDLREKLNSKRQSYTENLYSLASKTNWSSPNAKDIEQLLEQRRQRSYIRSMLENLERLGV